MRSGQGWAGLTPVRWLSAVAVVAVLASGCGGSGSPTLESTDARTTEAVPSASPAASPSGSPSPTTPPTTVPILTATVGNLLDRHGMLTSTVSDLVDAPIVTMPDVLGLPREQAEESVETAGLVPYLVDTFPPSGGPEFVLDTFPFEFTDARLGQTAFVEIDGPVDALLATAGQRLEGVLNGIQSQPIPGAAAWSIAIFLDDPLALDSARGVQVLGREVAVVIVAGDMTCSSGEGAPVPQELARSAEVSFVLDHSPADDLVLGPPAQVLGSAILVDCDA